MIKSFVCMALVALCAATVSAQNARTTAMGGVTNISDPTDILRNPAYMAEYKDIAQGTIDSNTVVNPILLVKSLGDKFSVGAYYRPARILETVSPRYALLNPTDPLPFFGTNAGNPSVDPIPHLLVGMDLGSAVIGADLFWERARFSGRQDNKRTVNTREIDSSTTFNQPGFNLGLTFSDIPVSIVLRSSLPMGSFRGEDVFTDTATGAANGDYTHKHAESVMGYLGGANLECVLKGASTNMTAGLNGDFLTYRKKIMIKNADHGPNGLGTADTVTNVDTTGRGDFQKILGLNAYLGFDKTLEAIGALTSVMVNGSVIHEPARTGDSIYNSVNYVSVQIAAGAEKTWEPVFIKFFDQAAARTGINYSITRTMKHGKDTQNSNTLKSSSRAFADRSGVSPYFGFGLGKGSVSFDVAVGASTVVNVFKLVNGTSATNDFASATLTFFPGKKNAE